MRPQHLRRTTGCDGGVQSSTNLTIYARPEIHPPREGRANRNLTLMVMMVDWCRAVGTRLVDVHLYIYLWIAHRLGLSGSIMYSLHIMSVFGEYVINDQTELCVKYGLC